jgi:hypothetical protein
MSYSNDDISRQWSEECKDNEYICYECECELSDYESSDYERWYPECSDPGCEECGCEDYECEDNEAAEDDRDDVIDFTTEIQVVEGMKLVSIRVPGEYVRCACCGNEMYAPRRPLSPMPGTFLEQALYWTQIADGAEDYPLGIRMLYGPTVSYPTQAIATVFRFPGADPIVGIWTSKAIRGDLRRMDEAIAYFQEQDVQTALLFEHALGLEHKDAVECPDDDEFGSWTFR